MGMGHCVLHVHDTQYEPGVRLGGERRRSAEAALGGPDTLITGRSASAVDPVRNLLMVNSRRGSQGSMRFILRL
jgi:hypothetical protein